NCGNLFPQHPSRSVPSQKASAFSHKNRSASSAAAASRHTNQISPAGTPDPASFLGLCVSSLRLVSGVSSRITIVSCPGVTALSAVYRPFLSLKTISPAACAFLSRKTTSPGNSFCALGMTWAFLSA
ncbi:MAG: hypothetical protein IJQ30_05500, partial [Acidaminococcaceae bacterium]|nr:hypothetical protein [Acidaminococcaceae bacterium]